MWTPFAGPGLHRLGDWPELDLEESHARQEVMGIYKELGLKEEKPAVARVKVALHYLQEARVK